MQQCYALFCDRSLLLLWGDPEPPLERDQAVLPLPPQALHLGVEDVPRYGHGPAQIDQADQIDQALLPIQ